MWSRVPCNPGEATSCSGKRREDRWQTFNERVDALMGDTEICDCSTGLRGTTLGIITTLSETTECLSFGNANTCLMQDVEAIDGMNVSLYRTFHDFRVDYWRSEELRNSSVW
jgi:hypothetical protein